jgi:N-acylneuraminate cytidylyltransferase
MKLAIIPARGGSKRIPRKNIKLFCGKPMIAWSIEAAIKSKCFDRIIVSTDDKEIAAIAINHGAEAPFIRPKNLADDFTATTPVINHAINWQKANGAQPTQVCCIYATAPFISPEDINKGLEQLQQTKNDFAFSVTSYAFPIQRAIRINSNNSITMFNPKELSTRSQDLEEAYHDAGQFYWGLPDAWLEERIVFGPQSTPILLPRHRVQDIDTKEDWLRAEWMFKAIQINGKVN